jgi:hypothetical protein
MGFVTKPNEELDPHTKDDVASPAIELFDVPETPPKPSNRDRLPLTKDEETYIVKCMTKYGTDYKKMFFDLSVNTYQHTEETLRKWGSRYIALTPAQRRLEVPPKVKHLIESVSTEDE